MENIVTNETVIRIVNRLNQLGNLSEDANCLSRFYGTTAHKVSGDLLISWMETAGLVVTKDGIGNIKGILQSKNKKAKHFVMGSHYDTVFNAGNYDGPLGILLGIEVAKRILKENIQLPFHLNVIAFADEEGARFNTAYLGSSVLVKKFDKTWLERTDDDGVSLNDVINENKGNIDDIFNAFIPKKDWLGYFEAHIEQGPILCKENLPVCLVSSIAAQTRINIEWFGECGHAGTYPMDLRNDALCAAAEFVLEVEKIGREQKTNLVATVGKLNLEPNVSNVIPGRVNHSLDLRSPDDLFLVAITKKLKRKLLEIARRRLLKYKWSIMQANPSVLCDSNLKQALGRSIISSGVNRLIEIPSGAGHDAVMISKVAPVSMLFIRCKAGISHNPLEYVAPHDIAEALKVCDNFINEIIILENKKSNKHE